jgi:hypothetical protein
VDEKGEMHETSRRRQKYEQNKSFNMKLQGVRIPPGRKERTS